jgi:TldD protein
MRDHLMGHLMGRRRFVGLGAGALAAAGAAEFVSGCATLASQSDKLGVTYFSRFGVDERMINEALAVALSRGADGADIYFEHTVRNGLALEDGAVNRAYSTVELGVGVRVVKGDQTGYGYTEELTLESLKRCAETAAAVADGPSRQAPGRYNIETRLPQRYPVHTRWDAVGVDSKLPLLDRLNAATFAADKRVKKVSVNFNDESKVILLATSDGLIVEDAQPMTILGLNCVAEDNGRRETNGYNVAGRSGMELYSDDRMSRIVNEAVARTTILFEAIQPPAGEMQVVLGAGSSGILLHEAIGHGMEADFNRKGVSIYSDKINKPIAKPFVNVVDDGTLDHQRGTINVDDEGNAPQKTMLVDGGVLATYLHDAISAKHYKVKPTGSGRRESYRYAPMPRMRSTYMLPGPHKREEIIASVKKGIYCDNFSNGQVQIGAGDFTFYVKNGYLIEDGKLTRPIKDVNIIGNGPKVLEQIDMVADDLKIDEGGWTCGKDGQGVPVSQGMPTVRVAALTVGGRGQG